MFTGIIRNQAVVIGRRKKGGQIRFRFRLKKPERLTAGESVAISGVCLTVAETSGRTFETDCIRETLENTTLGDLRIRDVVNAERSLKVGEPIGGHFVTGHADGVGVIAKILKRRSNRTFVLKMPASVARFAAPKGSVAIDGVSLTIQSVQGREMTVGLVPYTLRVTTLGAKRAGDSVNLEADLIARYLQILTSPTPGVGEANNPNISRHKLRRQGF